MPNCDFYATPQDHQGLLTWLFEEKTCHVYELSSMVEQPLRRFASVQRVLELFEERYTTGERMRTVHLQLHVLGASPLFLPNRVALNPKTCDGATFRYVAEGWGLVQLYLGTICRGELLNSHTNHFSQKSAGSWVGVREQTAKVGEWDFKRITSFSSRLNREIKRRSVARLGSRAVLPGALALWEAGMNFPPFRHGSIELQPRRA
jgi:hypothetical protein